MPSKKTKTAPKKKPPSVGKKPHGRPSVRTLEIENAIIEGLSAGIPLSQICRTENMPTPQTVRNWVKNDDAFSLLIAGAREAGHDAIAMEILAIADDTSNDTIETKHGPIPNKEWILRSKLRCEARFKLLAKWDPKRYGEKLTAELSGPNGGPIESAGPYRVSEADEEVIRRIAESRARMQTESSRDRE